MSVNARLNVGRLGVVCCRYLPNLYGEIEEELNAGLPTDRFEIDWWITSEHVRSRIAQPGTPVTPSGWQMMGAHVINHAVNWRDGVRAPGTWNSSTEPTLIVEIPADFQAIRRADMTLAADWRMHTREVFQWAFSKQYAVMWFATEGFEGQRRSYYILLKVPKLLGVQNNANRAD
jgi:predicted GNAT superfamily acetyltransferase